jgi:hypothetical protein
MIPTKKGGVVEIQEKEFEELASTRENYYELIMAVVNKYPNENRHQTALRLIREAQNQQPSPASGEKGGGSEAKKYRHTINDKSLFKG